MRRWQVIKNDFPFDIEKSKRSAKHGIKKVTDLLYLKKWIKPKQSPNQRLAWEKELNFLEGN